MQNILSTHVTNKHTKYNIKTNYLFCYFWLHWVSVAACRLSLDAESGGYSPEVVLSLWWLLLLRSTGSRHSGFSSRGTKAPWLHSMWDLPGLGNEPVSPALAGGFPSTAPPGYRNIQENVVLFLSYIIAPWKVQ